MKLCLSAERGLNTENEKFKASRVVTGSPKKKHLVSVNMRGSFARGMVTFLATAYKLGVCVRYVMFVTICVLFSLLRVIKTVSRYRCLSKPYLCT
jgi:hypothetical protein